MASTSSCGDPWARGPAPRRRRQRFRKVESGESRVEGQMMGRSRAKSQESRASRRSCYCLLPLISCLSTFSSAGCGAATSVSGTVTYEGEMVNDGWVTFTPADGKGSEAGGKVTAGKY